MAMVLVKHWESQESVWSLAEPSRGVRSAISTEVCIHDFRGYNQILVLSARLGVIPSSPEPHWKRYTAPLADAEVFVSSPFTPVELLLSNTAPTARPSADTAIELPNRRVAAALDALR